MKNSLRTLLFRIAAAVGGLLIISVGLLLLVMRPIPDGRVAEGIWAIKDISVNLFIIRGTRGFIATDADMNPDEVTQSLRKLSIVPRMSIPFCSPIRIRIIPGAYRHFPSPTNPINLSIPASP
jgi:hypothetical protein